ncbi:MAG: NifU family protein [Alphaproteobacteria bacterium]|nr:MAG: NifU family protein [Alphaproteobacteria bacterium]
MFIQTEVTPNPNAIKFIPGTEVSPLRSFDFRTPEEAMKSSPLARMLFEIGDVTGVYLGKDFISVTKDETSDWNTLKARVLAVIMDHAMSGLPIVDADAVDMDAGTQSDDPIVAQIIEILDERIRPAVANDGGDIVFDRFEDGVLFLHMRGACAGCPSATMTLKDGIENMMKHFVPEVEEVRQII